MEFCALTGAFLWIGGRKKTRLQKFQNQQSTVLNYFNITNCSLYYAVHENVNINKK